MKPSSNEAKELHDLMMQVVERNVDKIDGETVVRMEDTQVCSDTPVSLLQ